MMAKKKHKRVLVLSDSHCGHVAGLTPPEYQYQFTGNPRHDKFAQTQQMLWALFSEKLELHRPYDILIYNGDAIDGKGQRSGATELITSDRNEQIRMAKRVIDEVRAKTVVMTYGTPYHTGLDEDWEEAIETDEIRSHGFWNINGAIFDVKHKIGSSQIPHGRLTPLAREIMWNRIWHARGMQPKADVLIRSHAHYYEMTDHDGCLGFITPSLQGFGSKFGARQCSGTVDFGFIWLDCYERGSIEWGKEIITGEIHERKAVSL